MKDQLPKSALQIWKDSHSVTSSPELAGGATHCSLPESPQQLRCGRDRRRASHSASQVSSSDSLTSDTLPPSLCASLTSADLQFFLGNRLRQQLENTGSTIYSLSWKDKVTPAGRPYCQRAASVPRTKEIDCSLVPWPTATTIDNNQVAGQGAAANHPARGSTLGGAVRLANWPSPCAQNGTVNGYTDWEKVIKRKEALRQQNLQDVVILSSWATPTTRDHKSGGANLEKSLFRKDGKMRNDLVDYQAYLASWPTPMANGNDRAPNPKKAMSTQREDGSKIQQRLQDFAAITQPIRITADGRMLTGSDAGMGSYGQLNPAHSRWLMGFPPEWDGCAVTAMPSSPKSRQNSSKPLQGPLPMPKTKRVRPSAQPATSPRQRAVRLFNGDSVDVLRQLSDNSVDSVVCDPPYGLSKEPDMAEVMRHWLACDDYKHKGGGFMGKSWDSFVPGPAIWKECLRVLKPGGHLLAFFGSRTYDMGTLAIRLAGFEIRDQIMWVYGSGFPKSMDVSKAIDKAADAERQVIGRAKGAGTKDPDSFGNGHNAEYDITAPATDEAKQWEGWGTALKPAHEPICVARKPLAGAVAANVLAHGTGGLNIDGCRVPTDEQIKGGSGGLLSHPRDNTEYPDTDWQPSEHGRWPANLVHDGSEEVLAGFPQTAAAKKSMRGVGLTGNADKVYGKGDPLFNTMRGINDNGGCAARYFYCAKASKADRNYGLTGVEHSPADLVERKEGSAGIENPRAGAGRTSGSKNLHPTVKPIALMEWLVRLVTPPGGVVLDPFMGSGSTGIAAVKQGFRFVGVELSEDYFKVAQERIVFARSNK